MSDSKAKTASQILFQNSLAEVVRKLRSSKKSEKDTIQECIQDIKSEITSKVQMVKVTAVVKLTYFTMLGYPADYGAFNVVEVMADQNFQNKRAGYIAASLTFNEQTDVLPLCTALLKRDLASTNMFEVGLALYCLASVATPDLARDLVSDVVNLLQHPKPYIRKKAVLCLYKLFLQYPDALRPTYPKLKDMIEESDRSETDPAVRGAIVGILCEMARRNPSNFLSLAVPFFSLLSSVHNNWSLIKVVKVFGYFAPLEPRLGKKLAEPISNLINSTSAKSVQYECILAVANGMSKVTSVTKLAVDKMKLFVEDRDQNLKYLGLDAMSRVMIENPKMLLDQRDTILKCLIDNDATIRGKALEILCGVTTPKNLVSTVNSLYDGCVRSPPDEDWSNVVIEAIIETVRHDDYARVSDFEWYCGVLIDLALIDLSHFRHGALIESELVTILTRVNAIRPYGVESLAVLLSNSTLLGCDTTRSSQWRVLKAAAFACGEYPHWVINPLAAVECLISEKVASMPVELQVLCVGAAGKIYSHAVHPCDRHINLVEGEEDEEPLPPADADELKAVLYPSGITTVDDTLTELHGILLYCHSIYPDVQEKAQFVHYLTTNSPACAHVFYQRDLLAVAEGAQKSVAPPADLDLDTPFCEDIPALLPDSSDDSDSSDGENGSDGEELTVEMVRRKDRQRKEQMAAFYIPEGGEEDDLPPVTTLDAKEADVASPGSKRLALGRKGGKKSHTINRTMAKPENYVAASDRAGRSAHSPEEDEATRRLRAIDVTQALRPDEKLPEAIPYANLLNKSAREATEEMRRAEAALRLDPIVLHEDKSIRVSAQVLECKGKKDGLHLGVSITMSNLLASSSIYDVAIARTAHSVTIDENGDVQLAADDDQTPVLSVAGTLMPAEVVDKKVDKKGKRGDAAAEAEAEEAPVVDLESPFTLCEKLKPGALSSLECVLVLPALPPTFAQVPLLFNVTFTRDKKSTQLQLSFPLVYKYFAAMLNTESVPTLPEFHSAVLAAHLANDDVSSISATIPLFPLPSSSPVTSSPPQTDGDGADGKKKKKKVSKDEDQDPSKWSSSEMEDKKKEVLLFALPALKAQLRLHTMDVFKDSTSLYGQVVGRKSHVNKSHMAFLLQDVIVEMEMPVAAGEEGEPTVARLPALSVTAKGVNAGMLEAAVQEIATILTEEGKKLCVSEEVAGSSRSKKSKK